MSESGKCKNGDCSFYGSEKFNGYCSGCVATTEESKDVPQILIPVTQSSSNSIKKRKSAEISTDDFKTITVEGSSDKDQAKKKRKVNRCSVCNKKVGLLGFDCRCGGLYCALHRGDNDHDCQFDYKSVQRAELAEKNPRVVGEKVKKI